MKKVFYIIVFVILVIILSINVFSLLDISIFGIRVYKVGSGSMEPYLKVNDVIIIKSSDDYNLQDVVTYKNNDEYITHRIVSINGAEIITKGDANNTNDESITKDKIVGKLICKFHLYSFICYVLYKPITWILIFVIGFFALFLGSDKNLEAE